MLQQSLPINHIIGNLSVLCSQLRECGLDLCQVKMPVATLVFDVLKAMGIPDNSLNMVLTPGELGQIGDPEYTAADCLKCQLCAEEATKLMPYRGNWLLLCDDHEHALRK